LFCLSKYVNLLKSSNYFSRDGFNDLKHFDESVQKAQGEPLKSDVVQTVQVNLGLLCNLSCRHCHVEASPRRKEVMRWGTMQSVLRLTNALRDVQVDLTGGAPELNPNFRKFVSMLRADRHTVQVRSNLTVFSEPGFTDLPEFLAKNHVHLVASLPCYLDENVDSQRGKGTYLRSISALRRLNELGYGDAPTLPLNLVYNPGGPFLPPEQAKLEDAYRHQLDERFGIRFNRLLTITNMPLGRFFHDLEKAGMSSSYERLLQDSFNPDTLDGLMCRHQICVAWDGRLADCDFNHALGLSLDGDLPRHIDQIDPKMLSARKIVTGQHCFGCTAGCGSSCRGALVA
jgi:radical SAM/Cys-rich protein